MYLYQYKIVEFENYLSVDTMMHCTKNTCPILNTVHIRLPKLLNVFVLFWLFVRLFARFLVCFFFSFLSFFFGGGCL